MRGGVRPLWVGIRGEIEIGLPSPDMCYSFLSGG
jgi:hypothetical protein